MARTYTAGLIGCGRMGATIDDEVRDRPIGPFWMPFSHAAAYAACDRVRLVAVSDVDANKAETIRKRYSAERAYADWRDLVRREKLDILSIATRPRTHAEMTVFAAENGVKAIYCEKALCGSMEEADRMLAACARHGVRFAYGAQRRYIPAYRKVRELIETGALGEFHTVVGCHGVRASAQWGHTHTADVLQFWASDAEAESVQATALVDPTEIVDDRIDGDPVIVSGYVKFKNGVNGYLITKPGSDFEAIGTDGRVMIDERAEPLIRYQRADARGVLVSAEFPATEHVSGSLAAVRELVRALDTGTDTIGNLALACRSQEIVLAMIESELRGGARVSLPLEHRSLHVCRNNW